MPSDTAVSTAVQMPDAFARTSLPGRIVFGDGAVRQLADELDQRDLRRAMLIAADYDPSLAAHGREALGERVKLRWAEVRQHVPRELAARATNAATAAGVDVVVAIGGGSTTGLGKAIAVSTGLPLAVVPTTYAGSERPRSTA
jgi:maleylacetate reductase